MILAALQGLTQFAIPALTQGSKNCFQLKNVTEHLFHPFQHKKISSKLSLTPSGSGSFLGCLNDIIKQPFQLITKYILPSQMGSQIVYDIRNKSQSHQKLSEGDTIAELGVVAANSTEQLIYPLSQQTISGNSFKDMETNMTLNGKPIIFSPIQNQQINCRSHLNSSNVTVLNQSNQKIKINKLTLLGHAVTISPNATDVPVINQAKSTGLNVSTPLPASIGANNQLRMPFQVFQIDNIKQHLLPFIVTGLLNSANSQEKAKLQATPYERITLFKDTAMNMLEQFALKQTFKSDWSSAQSQLMMTTNNKKKHDKQKHDKKDEHHHGLLGLFFAPITAITSHLFTTRTYKAIQQSFQIILTRKCKKIMVTGNVNVYLIGQILYIQSLQCQNIHVDCIY